MNVSNQKPVYSTMAAPISHHFFTRRGERPLGSLPERPPLGSPRLSRETNSATLSDNVSTTPPFDPLIRRCFP